MKRLGVADALLVCERPPLGLPVVTAVRDVHSPLMSLTCRVCKATYNPEDNGPRACRSHPGTLRGESARKGDWEGATGPTTGKGGDLVYSWSCCGAPADDPGCVFAPHTSYDDM
ncbi:MAG: hypothetical protein SGPRY_001017 [Prymnesium sp.]